MPHSYWLRLASLPTSLRTSLTLALTKVFLGSRPNMPHSYWLRPRRQGIVYSENRIYRNVRSIPSSKESFMARRMVSAATKLESTGNYLMDNAARLDIIENRRHRNVRNIPSSNEGFMAGAKRFCANITLIVTSSRLTHRLPIFFLLLLSGLWIISGLSNMSQYPGKSESLNTNLGKSLNSQNSISFENKYEMTIKKSFQKNSLRSDSLVGFNHIRSDVKEDIHASLAKFLRSLIDEALMKFNADKTGMADFALESGGGSVIINRCSKTFTNNSVFISIFGIPLVYKSNSPRTVITPDVNVGECWSFEGSTGMFVIRLSHKIKITAFSMEHIPKSISPFGHIKSAPKDFSVYSLSGLDDHEGVYFGSYTYKDDGRPIQQFITQVNNANPTQYVEVRISSNYGNPECTCLYRFRVHGVLYIP